MMKCLYCDSENNSIDQACSVCGAPLYTKRPQLKEYVSLEDSALSFQELQRFHTYDLLILLRLVREERSKSYNLMRTVQKAPEGIEIDKSIIEFGESEYRLYTARMKLIEGLLVDRMGYKPKRVDDKLLTALKHRMESK
ncbi:hypothetical protein NKR17_21150 [Priestia flexa]|uniref:hypothetical protein n=3 Tax=Priestia TaxID=2800373 RepID=UPI000C23210F|nr:hypothetical protein [Priestia flexa]MCP1191506.1 hypothetical protein [Priestia flexa]MCP1191532.1 hypothetical protein [Priestia flexa]QCS51156.1 hypothetical protein FED53_00140 [Priestia flexa]